MRELIDLDADIERAVELVSEATLMKAVAELVEGSTYADKNTITEATTTTQWTINDDAKTDPDDGAPFKTDAQTSAVFWGNTRYWGFDLTAALGKWRN